MTAKEAEETRPELSVVVPIYNEEEVLPALSERLLPVLERTGCSWELVLVNDGSADRSWELMQQLQRGEPRVTLVNFSRNFGHQIAITAGMDHARGDAVVVMDADLQDPPEVLGAMIERWREGYDVVYGVRTEREQETLFKKLSASLFYRLLQAMAPIEIPVDTGDFRLLSRRAVDALHRMPERSRYVRGMVAWLGFRQIGVPFQRQARHGGVTKYPLLKMIAFAADGLVGFSAVPLRFATLLGFFMAAAAALYFGYAAMQKLLLGTTIQGWASLVGVMVFIGSAQLICLGIIGEYVGRIYDEVKGRPLYLVETVTRGDGIDSASPGDRA